MARKTWEIRGRRTAIRGKIALTQAGIGLVVGTCDLIDVLGPLTLNDLRRNAPKLGQVRSDVTTTPYKKTYAWVLKDVRKHSPKRSRHLGKAFLILFSCTLD